MPARALIVLLLILNLGVALWWIARGDAAPADAPALPQGAERLQLLGEARPSASAPVPAHTDDGSAAAPAEEEAAAPDTAAVDPPAAAVDAARVASACHALGPFDGATAAARAATQLRSLVQRLAMRESRTAPRGWRVLLPAQADRAAAAAAAERLAAAGFSDHYLLPAAADGTVDIALGRFSGEEAAQRHRAALRAAGFEAVADPIGDASVRHWIDVAVAADADVEALQRAVAAAGSERIDCATLPAPVR